jgi:hypothetical protein
MSRDFVARLALASLSNRARRSSGIRKEIVSTIVAYQTPMSCRRPLLYFIHWADLG